MKTQKGKRTKKSQLLKLFLQGMGVTFIVCSLILIGVIFCYNKFIGDGSFNGLISSNKNVTEVDENGTPVEKINTNLAVFGVDKDGYRTDVIFVVNFNSTTDKVKVVSVPRDTKVIWSDEQKQNLKELGKYSISVSKLNEMTSYAGIKNIKNFTVNQLERILNVKIDNYVVVDIDAFKNIVDAVGGVELEVPQRMYHVDRAGGLYIDLQPGFQALDGEKAEQFVRFRGYIRGDEDRILAQQTFLEAFARKVLSPSIITKIPNMIKVVFDSVQTDISLLELTKYYPYLNDFKMSNLSFYTVPGEGRYEGGISYFFINQDEMGDFIKEVFFEKPQTAEEDSAEIIEDKTLTIEILNGSGVAGAAGSAKALLEAEGYTILSIGNYKNSDVQITQIITQEEDKAKQFLVFYPDAEIVISSDIATDIQIILGKN
jgi:LCP family protein required for cell wall assembly